MNRPAKLSFTAAALIGTAALAAFIVDHVSPSYWRIAKLKARARKGSRDLPYRVTLRHRSANLSGVAATYAPYWTWVSVIDGKTSELGPVDTMELSEALELARQQWKQRKRPSDPEPPPRREYHIPARAQHDTLPLVAGAKTAHRMSFTPVDGERMQIDCTCGKWSSRPTEPGHQFENGCPSCDDVMREWEEHAGTSRPPLLPAEPINPAKPLTAAEYYGAVPAEHRPECLTFCGPTGGLCRHCGKPFGEHPWGSGAVSGAVIIQEVHDVKGQ